MLFRGRRRPSFLVFLAGIEVKPIRGYYP